MLVQTNRFFSFAAYAQFPSPFLSQEERQATRRRRELPYAGGDKRRRSGVDFVAPSFLPPHNLLPSSYPVQPHSLRSLLFVTVAGGWRCWSPTALERSTRKAAKGNLWRMQVRAAAQRVAACCVGHRRCGVRAEAFRPRESSRPRPWRRSGILFRGEGQGGGRSACALGPFKPSYSRRLTTP